MIRYPAQAFGSLRGSGRSLLPGDGVCARQCRPEARACSDGLHVVRRAYGRGKGRVLCRGAKLGRSRSASSVRGTSAGNLAGAFSNSRAHGQAWTNSRPGGRSGRQALAWLPGNTRSGCEEGASRAVDSDRGVQSVLKARAELARPHRHSPDATSAGRLPSGDGCNRRAFLERTDALGVSNSRQPEAPPVPRANRRRRVTSPSRCGARPDQVRPHAGCASRWIVSPSACAWPWLRTTMSTSQPSLVSIRMSRSTDTSRNWPRSRRETSG